MLNRLLKIAVQQRRLKGKFRALNSSVVIIGLVIGFPAWIVWARWSRLALGIPLEGGSMDGIVVQFLIWVVLAIVGIVLTLYVGILVAASVAMIFLVLLGAVSSREAFDYVVYSRYPKAWYDIAA